MHGVLHLGRRRGLTRGGGDAEEGCGSGCETRVTFNMKVTLSCFAKIVWVCFVFFVRFVVEEDLPRRARRARRGVGLITSFSRLVAGMRTHSVTKEICVSILNSVTRACSLTRFQLGLYCN